jgi:DNA-binding response OmpR family regulator
VKVLLVEDEKKINSLIRKGLEPHGFSVDTATTDIFWRQRRLMTQLYWISCCRVAMA